MFKDILAGLGIFIFVIGVTWAVQGNNFFMYKFFAPKMEEARHEVFVNTVAYTDGNIQELRNYQIAYIQADDNHKKALASVIQHQFAAFPTDKLPLDLQQFISSLNRSGDLK